MRLLSSNAVVLVISIVIDVSGIFLFINLFYILYNSSVYLLFSLNPYYDPEAPVSLLLSKVTVSH